MLILYIVKVHIVITFIFIPYKYNNAKLILRSLLSTQIGATGINQGRGKSQDLTLVLKNYGKWVQSCKVMIFRPSVRLWKVIEFYNI